MSTAEVPAVESYVQLGPDSSGKKVRNLLVTTLASDGSTTSAYQQVVGLADEHGFPLIDQTLFWEEALVLLREIRSGIERITEELA